MQDRPVNQSILTAYRDLKAEYASGLDSRFIRQRTGLNLLGSGADWHYKSESKWLKAVEYARDLAANSSVAGMILDRSVSNIFQGGFRLDPQTGDVTLDDKLSAAWEEWGNTPENCDASGRYTLHQLAEFCARSVKVDGDVFVLPMDTGTLKLTEAHRCRTPSGTKKNVVHGVKLDDWRHPQEYWFTPDDIDPWKSLPASVESKMIKLAARDVNGELQVWHIADPKRFSQTRGFTAFNPIFEVLSMVDELLFAQLVKALATSCFVMIREQPLAPVPGGRPPLGVQETVVESDSSETLREQLAPGAEVKGRPGETIKGFSPQVPNPEFDGFFKLLLKMLGANLNVPLVALLIDASETNFSGWRGAIEEAKIGWRRDQLLYSRTFYQRAYRFFVQHLARRDPAIGAALGKLGPLAYNVRVSYPRWPYIQPLDDINAAATELDKLLISPRRQAMERGQNVWELTDETVEDNKYRVLAAFRAAAETEAELAAAGNTEVKINPAAMLWLQQGIPLTLDRAVPLEGLQLNNEGTPGLNGAQILAAVDVMIRVRDTSIVPDAAIELLKAVGIPADRAAVMVANTPQGLDRTAGDADFKRQVVMALLGNPGAREALYNGVDVDDLLATTGLVPEAGYQPPWIAPMMTPNLLVTGNLTKDAAGDIVGSGVEAVGVTATEPLAPLEPADAT